MSLQLSKTNDLHMKETSTPTHTHTHTHTNILCFVSNDKCGDGANFCYDTR